MSNYCQLAHAERCRIMVSTHSDMLVDSLTDKHESVVVCEKHQCRTTMRQLEQCRLLKVKWQFSRWSGPNLHAFHQNHLVVTLFLGFPCTTLSLTYVADSSSGLPVLPAP